MGTQREFADFGPGGKASPTPMAQAPRSPLWTADKAALVASYIHHFLFVTKRGVYFDLFAAPQASQEDWCVRQVLESRTKEAPAITYYATCDIDPHGVAALEQLAQSSKVPFRVYEDDANEKIHQMLCDAPVSANMPCFCLIDQRTFQCKWSTVEPSRTTRRTVTRSRCSTS